MTFGEEKNLGFDEHGHEQRVRVDAIGMCPKCGKEVELTAETDMWEEGPDGRWLHAGYGPSSGVCEDCDQLIVDYWEGTFAYDLSEHKKL